MSSKKTFKALGIACLGCLCLTACDEIIAKTTDYDDPIISNDAYSDVYNNVLNIVYDALRDGSLASDVVDEVLYEYAKSVFGPYNAVVDDSGVTLKAVVKDITEHTDEESGVVSGVSAVTDEFITSHKAYWSTNNEDERIDDNAEVVDEEAAPSQGEYARVVAKWDTIEERISETLYSTINTGNYSYRSIFKEKEFLMSLYGSFEKVASPLDEEVKGNLTESLIYPNIEEEEVFEEIEGISTTPLLHREYYQSNYGLEDEESSADPYTYIEDEIIPAIYQDLLVEQYLLDESYNTLGRTYARKVNIVAISDNEDHQESAAYLMNEFVKEYLDAEPESETNSIVDSTNKVDLDTLKMLSNAWRGIGIVEDKLGDEEKALLSNAGFSTVTSSYGADDSETTYSGYLGTKYGDLIEKINKLDDNPYLTDESVESELTGASSYPVSTGIKMQQDNIRLESYTTDGWYIKNGGLTTLPDNIRTRLFNISVANAIQEGDEEGLISHDRWQWNGSSWTYSKDNDANNYVAQINGKYYLKNQTSEASDFANKSSDVLFYDRDSSTYYIIQIEEAISSSKLSKTSDNRYAVTRGNDVMEDAVNNVAKIVASDSSYATLSTEWWLEQATLSYHDDVVYDYFYANYPDLFDD
ncbi:MAG: hypothetical protein LUC16_00135 [Coprobacillus sp.]|nr:hypothetical protein [Coprobacillus sp.]